MNHYLFNYNRRGCVCALRRDLQEKELPHEMSVVFRALYPLQAKFYVVMKHIDDDRMLVAPVFAAKHKDCRSLQISGKRFWVNYMTFYAVPVSLMEYVPGKFLDYSFKTITAIYSSHNNVLKNKWRHESEARTVNDVQRKAQQKFREEERKRAQRESHRIYYDDAVLYG